MSLRELRERHEVDVPPARFAGAAVAGHCLRSIDAHVCGCVEAFLRRKGRLPSWCVADLVDLHVDLSEAIEEMSERGAVEPYVLRLHEMSGMMLRHIATRNAARKRPRRWWQMRVRRLPERA